MSAKSLSKSVMRHTQTSNLSTNLTTNLPKLIIFLSVILILPSSHAFLPSHTQRTSNTHQTVHQTVHQTMQQTVHQTRQPKYIKQRTGGTQALEAIPTLIIGGAIRKMREEEAKKKVREG